jgi:hypothetical protein
MNAESTIELCVKCGVPVEVVPPKPTFFPFIAFKQEPWCKTCVVKATAEYYSKKYLCECPYRNPWPREKEPKEIV